jgi:hypothetical protein
MCFLASHLVTHNPSLFFLIYILASHLVILWTEMIYFCIKIMTVSSLLVTWSGRGTGVNWHVYGTNFLIVLVKKSYKPMGISYKTDKYDLWSCFRRIYPRINSWTIVTDKVGRSTLCRTSWYFTLSSDWNFALARIGINLWTVLGDGWVS